MLDRGTRLADAAAAAFDRHGGPLLVAAADAPRLSPAHAQMALGDLADGADASFGPGMDGSWYLVALAAPHAALLALLDEPVQGEHAMGRLLGVAHEHGLEVGLLRMERLLRTPRDLAAVSVDPLTPDTIRTALCHIG